MSDFIDELEQELRAASQRRVRLAAARLPRPRVRPGLPAAALRGVPVAVAVLIAIAVAVVVLTEVRHTTPRRSPSRHAVAGRQQLVDILAPLRRPQTATDRTFPRSTLAQGPAITGPRGTPDISLIRYATTTPWGERIFFVPMKPANAASANRYVNSFPLRLRGQARHDIALRAARGETLSVFSAAGSGGGDASAPDIRAGDSLQTEGAGRSFAGGSTQTRLVLVVPDGVAKVKFMLARQPNGNEFGAPTYAHPLAVTVPVHDNVAAARVDRECCSGRPPMIWYAANGQVIQRIGDFAKVNRVNAAPKPGLPTPLSRAAQRDPSTPNRVWVTPSVGTPHTTFRVHFRILLNGADYHYRFTGTHCPRYTFPGGTGKPNALRGGLWSDPLRAVTGQALCPGTYHVAVSVMDLGRFGNLKHPINAFGTTTFTVRP